MCFGRMGIKTNVEKFIYEHVYKQDIHELIFGTCLVFYIQLYL